MIGKGCHPLTAALYLKRVEGRTRNGTAIRPKAVSARTHALTRLSNFRDEGHIRRDYYDIDDFSMMHVVFEDDTIATVFASDIILGGIHNWLEVAANNHRTVCNINPNTAMQVYNPLDANFADVYTVEKIETKLAASLTRRCGLPGMRWRSLSFCLAMSVAAGLLSNRNLLPIKSAGRQRRDADHVVALRLPW